MQASPNGVIYYNKGSKCLVRLVVSLMTMRRHYKGDITVFLEGPHPEGFEESIKREFNVDVVHDDNPATGTYVRAVELSRKSPYDLTVWMDSDTVILGTFDELFEEAKSHDFVIAHFAGWNSDGRAISKRIERYKGIVTDAYIAAALKYGPAINCGVYAWKKGSPFLEEWVKVAKEGEKTGMFIPDEVACQVILPQYDTKIMPLKFNVSCIHDPRTEDPRVIHFHGQKHCKEHKSCDIWLREFKEALQRDLCGIRKLACGDGDRRLRKFFKGKYGRPDLVQELKGIIEGKRDRPVPVPANVPCIPVPSNTLSDVTVVTACDTKYVGHLMATLPNWIKYKQIDRYPMIVYVNGFGVAREDGRLNFLRESIPNLRIISWEMPEAADQRERMLTAFVLGAARDVDTKYWLKLDADAYAEDSRPLLEERMKEYALCGHKWGYSFAKHMKPLIDWANAHKAFQGLPADVFDPSRVDGKRYYCERVASYVQLHKSEFVRMAAGLVTGGRLPVPSHDTYLWYVANRLGLPIWRHNFKRHRGVTNKSNIESLKIKLQEVEVRNGRA